MSTEGTGHRSSTAVKIVLGLVGWTVLIAGVAMIVLPGPALILIPLGVAILATQFEWAKGILDRFKKWVREDREG